ncbi:terminal quinol oxidase, subunit DoxD, partial [mine drainage metagenome]
SGWFNWIGGAGLLPLSERAFKRLALVLFWISVAFIVLTYNYYRGSVVTPFHGGPTSPSKHHWTLSQGSLRPTARCASTLMSMPAPRPSRPTCCARP